MSGYLVHVTGVFYSFDFFLFLVMLFHQHSVNQFYVGDYKPRDKRLYCHILLDISQRVNLIF